MPHVQEDRVRPNRIQVLGLRPCDPQITGKAHECPEWEGLESEIAEGCSAVGASEARLPRAGLLLPLDRRRVRLHLAALHERHRAMQPW